MIIIPAIDIIDGKPVRLYQGDYSKKELVAADVLETALSFQEQGAEFLHLVDLDGAKAGRLVNKDTVLKVLENVKIPIEIGGGIRTFEDVNFLINKGIARVIIGTKAIEDINFIKMLVYEFGEKIAVGIDCKNEYLCGDGWLKESRIHYIDFAKEMESIGVKNIIVTDISKDGTLEGANIDMIKALKKEVSIDITVSGGIKDIECIKSLKEIGVYAVITGKALYSNKLVLKEALEVSYK